jgi:MFS family permease
MASSHASVANRPGAIGRLWHRELDHYPNTGPRYWYLGIVVITTVVLYYELYIGGAVATQILAGYHMSFLYYVTILVIGNAIGAFASLATGLADRVGRANLVVYGSIITALLALIAVPNVDTKLSYGIVFGFTSIVEGIVLVATPALVRDFSPQVGRAQAMGFWTMGPVLGSLVVSQVSSHTISHLHAWQDQYIITGIVGLVVALIALVGLRELTPSIRDQVMISLEERTVLEMRARGMDLEAATERPFAQMFKPDIMAPALGISLFLAGYYTAVAFFPIYFQTVLNFSSSQSNSLLNWYWSANAISLIVFGVLSDRLSVRKPFMLAGALGSILVAIAFIARTNATSPTFGSIAVLLAFIGIWGGMTFGPWMAGFTETVERRNPALIATGLAVWGWILRVVVALLFLVLPHAINSVTPLVQDGPGVQAVAAKVDPQLLAEVQAHPDIFQALSKYSDPSKIPAPLLSKAITTVGADTLTKASNPTQAGYLNYLNTHNATKVSQAQKDAPHQWRHWFIACMIGQILFIPLIFIMAGYWSSRRAKEELEREEGVLLSGASTHSLGGAQPA